MALTTAQTAQLKTEITTDPFAYGWIAPYNAGNDTGLAEALNRPRDGSAGTGRAISINRGYIDTQELVEAIVQSEMPANANQRDWLIMVSQGDRVRVDAGSQARNGLLAIFGAATTTRTNLTAVSSRAGSRVEELFGRDVAVGADDIARVRQS